MHDINCAMLMEINIDEKHHSDQHLKHKHKKTFFLKLIVFIVSFAVTYVDFIEVNLVTLQLLSYSWLTKKICKIYCK